jgi:hypothetical protein
MITLFVKSDGGSIDNYFILDVASFLWELKCGRA